LCGGVYTSPATAPHDEWDPSIPVYDPYGTDDEFIDD
jgi:hypothetical protein